MHKSTLPFQYLTVFTLFYQRNALIGLLFYHLWSKNIFHECGILQASNFEHAYLGIVCVFFVVKYALTILTGAFVILKKTY